MDLVKDFAQRIIEFLQEKIIRLRKMKRKNKWKLAGVVLAVVLVVVAATAADSTESSTQSGSGTETTAGTGNSSGTTASGSGGTTASSGNSGSSDTGGTSGTDGTAENDSSSGTTDNKNSGSNGSTDASNGTNGTGAAGGNGASGQSGSGFSGSSAGGSAGSGNAAGGTSTASVSADSTGSSSSSGDEYSLYEAAAFSIVNEEEAVVSIQVDELDILSVKEGQTATITMDAVEDQEFEGTITKVSATASGDSSSAKHPVEITLEKTDDMLYGMSASATIQIDEAENAVLIPVSALPKEERKKRVEEALERVQLGARKKHKPNELSGGQQQRVAIARAIASRPSLFLADEPTGNLDSATGKEIMKLFHELHEQGNTIVLITHDESVAQQASRSIHILDGKVLDDAITFASRKKVRS